MEELKTEVVKVQFTQDEWVPESILEKNFKLGKTMGKQGLTIMVKVRRLLEVRTNPETKEKEYKITERGKRLKMNWNALKR